MRRFRDICETRIQALKNDPSRVVWEAQRDDIDRSMKVAAAAGVQWPASAQVGMPAEHLSRILQVQRNRDMFDLDLEKKALIFRHKIHNRGSVVVKAMQGLSDLFTPPPVPGKPDRYASLRNLSENYQNAMKDPMIQMCLDMWFADQNMQISLNPTKELMIRAVDLFLDTLLTGPKSTATAIVGQATLFQRSAAMGGEVPDDFRQREIADAQASGLPNPFSPEFAAQVSDPRPTPASAAAASASTAPNYPNTPTAPYSGYNKQNTSVVRSRTYPLSRSPSL